MRKSFSTGSLKAQPTPAKGHKKATKNTKGTPKIKTCGNEEKDKCIFYLQKAMKAGLLKGRDIYAGFNSVVKLAERGRANAIISFRDTPPTVLNSLKIAAGSRGIPVIIFSKVSTEFATVLGLNKLSCLAVPFATHIDSIDSMSEEDSHNLSVTLDQLRDYVVEVAKEALHKPQTSA